MNNEEFAKQVERISREAKKLQETGGYAVAISIIRPSSKEDMGTHDIYGYKQFTRYYRPSDKDQLAAGNTNALEWNLEKMTVIHLAGLVGKRLKTSDAGETISDVAKAVLTAFNDVLTDRENRLKFIRSIQRDINDERIQSLLSEVEDKFGSLENLSDHEVERVTRVINAHFIGQSIMAAMLDVCE